MYAKIDGFKTTLGKTYYEISLYEGKNETVYCGTVSNFGTMQIEYEKDTCTNQKIKVTLFGDCCGISILRIEGIEINPIKGI